MGVQLTDRPDAAVRPRRPHGGRRRAAGAGGNGQRPRRVRDAGAGEPERSGSGRRHLLAHSADRPGLAGRSGARVPGADRPDGHRRPGQRRRGLEHGLPDMHGIRRTDGQRRRERLQHGVGTRLRPGADPVREHHQRLDVPVVDELRAAQLRHRTGKRSGRRHRAVPDERTVVGDDHDGADRLLDPVPLAHDAERLVGRRPAGQVGDVDDPDRDHLQLALRSRPELRLLARTGRDDDRIRLRRPRQRERVARADAVGHLERRRLGALPAPDRALERRGAFVGQLPGLDLRVLRRLRGPPLLDPVLHRLRSEPRRHDHRPGRDAVHRHDGGAERELHVQDRDRHLYCNVHDGAGLRVQPLGRGHRRHAGGRDGDRDAPAGPGLGSRHVHQRRTDRDELRRKLRSVRAGRPLAVSRSPSVRPTLAALDGDGGQRHAEPVLDRDLPDTRRDRGASGHRAVGREPGHLEQPPHRHLVDEPGRRLQRDDRRIGDGDRRARALGDVHAHLARGRLAERHRLELRRPAQARQRNDQQRVRPMEQR